MTKINQILVRGPNWY